MVRGKPAPWVQASTAPPCKPLHYGRELHQLLTDRDRCIEQQALLHMEQGRLLVRLRHMIVVCKGAYSGPEADVERMLMLTVES
ncbi:hypothetical protein HaLaN_12546 [Haematococcus lacustris]|uniref:Uncharacterized protein n=1 Tax=Haematococcus lacustris TaxID=44745 RepID=A0A699Z3K7_HAELA|nr:hypothetical protein HaLaN_12546 [Haematococcus lacustris]